MDFVSPFYENRYQNEHIVEQKDVVPNDGADVPNKGAEEMMSLTILECLFVSISVNTWHQYQIMVSDQSIFIRTQ